MRTANDPIATSLVRTDAERIRGLLKSPRPQPLSVENMDRGIERHPRDEQVRMAARRKAAGR